MSETLDQAAFRRGVRDVLTLWPLRYAAARWLAAKSLVWLYGYCEDKHFEIGCAGCQASHIVRSLRDEPTPNGDAAYQKAMAAEELDFKDWKTVDGPAW